MDCIFLIEIIYLTNYTPFNILRLGQQVVNRLNVHNGNHFNSSF